MRIKYFEDTDTMLIEFSDREVAETIEISENFYAEVDEEGRVVALTFEHASQYADFSEFSISPIILGKKERGAKI